MILRLLLSISTLGAVVPLQAAAETPSPLLVAAADCSQAAADAAAQTGGRVLSVRSRNQDGRMVCVVTVIVPAKDGGRPRRQTVVVPQ
ncbi:hypothetical protein [Aureimonas leprariae]|uniref:Uncharacterized protein n=1 Tax=Plantimonas leprariae TaxID=2615207 RepID=A0A7V7PPL5_9HYPH|nr:hypothetical protein [Aureimonas leprariae]KAB0679939.1 hypothetical protein F6X38_10210 [Aureimonas leprariae]